MINIIWACIVICFGGVVPCSAQQNAKEDVYKRQPFECFHADGLIGSDLLKDLIVEIDSKAKTITVTSAEKASNVSLRKMLPFSGKGFMPIITLQAVSYTHLVLIRLIHSGYHGE